MRCIDCIDIKIYRMCPTIDISSNIAREREREKRLWARPKSPMCWSSFSEITKAAVSKLLGCSWKIIQTKMWTKTWEKHHVYWYIIYIILLLRSENHTYNSGQRAARLNAATLEVTSRTGKPICCVQLVIILCQAQGLGKWRGSLLEEQTDIWYIHTRSCVYICI